MPSQRKKGKKLVGFFATEEEARALFEAAKGRGKSVADFLRDVIREAAEEYKVRPPKSGSNDQKEKP